MSDWPEVLNGVKLAPSIQRKPSDADQHQRHELQDRGDDLHDARLGDAADVDERQRPDRDQRHREARRLRGGDAGEEEADVAGERHRHPGVAGPERDPVAPGDDEAGELAEPRLGVGIGPAGLGHDPRQPPEDHRQHQRADRGHRPADERDRPEGGERGRQQEDARADHVADDERGAGDEPEPAARRHARARAPSPQFAGAAAGAGAVAGASDIIAVRLSAAEMMTARITSSGQTKRSQRS